EPEAPGAGQEAGLKADLAVGHSQAADGAGCCEDVRLILLTAPGRAQHQAALAERGDALTGRAGRRLDDTRTGERILEDGVASRRRRTKLRDERDSTRRA